MTKAELLAQLTSDFRDGVPYAESFKDRLVNILTTLIEDGSVVLRVEGASPNGDSVSITAEDGAATDGDGGSVTITVGLADGGGTDGNLIIANLPAADPLLDNAIWSNNGVLTVSAGTP